MMITRVLAVSGFIVALVTPAIAKSPVRFTPDGAAILVNKDVHGERWAITFDADRSTVSGNVFIGDSVVKFLWCGITDATGDGNDLANGDHARSRL
jgi:hypothetical protein